MSHMRRTKHKSSDAMDHWLDTQGLYRKHTARDGSCLFRAVAEQLFYTQACHLRVRKQCVDHMRKNSTYYEELIEGEFDEYATRMENQFQWGGKVELEAMAKLYKFEVLVYHEVGMEPLKAVINGDWTTTVSLCFSHGNHYDSVYTKEHIANAAFCQSIVYDALYTGVFELTNVSYAVDEMLHNKTFKDQRRKEALLEQQNDSPASDVTAATDMRTWIARGVTPFPYKVAKALDPEIYRNIEFDVWSDMRRELRLGLLPATGELYVGLKCQVKLTAETAVSHSAYIQSITPGAVEVFIAELGERRTVAHGLVQALNQAEPASTNHRPYVQLNAAELGTKWRKMRLNRGRKTEPITAAPLVSRQQSSSAGGGYEGGGLQRPFEQNAISSNTTMQSYQPLEVCDVASPAPGMLYTSTPQPGAGPGPVPHFVTFMSSPSGSSLGYYTASPSPPPPLPPPTPGPSPATGIQVKDMDNNVINISAPKSVLLDGSDLSLIDKPTVRFFYNLGHDYFPLLNLTSTGCDNHLTESVGPASSDARYTLAPRNGDGSSGQLMNVYVECSCTDSQPIGSELEPCYTVPSYGYPMMYGYYHQEVPYYAEYTVDSRETGGTVALDHHQVSPPPPLPVNNDTTQQSLDNSGVYPFGLQFNRLPTSFLFHAPPPLNGVPYSPPPNGAFSIPQPPGVFSVPPPPVTPVNSQTPPWFVNQTSPQGK